LTKYCFITPVWGESYLETFLNVSLPTQLAPHNLPSLKNRQGVVYRIYTRPQDVFRLEASPALARLAKYIKTEVVGTRQVKFDASNHYDPFTACYRMGMETAAREQAAAIFLTADQVWADGSLSRIISLGDAGFGSVLISGPRVNQETFVPLFLNDHAGQDAITIASRRAVKLAMDHMHPWDRSLFWESDNLGRSASFMYWQVPDEGFIMRCFHLHPVLVNPSNGFPHFNGTIDGSNFVRKACPDLKDLFVIQDSDEVMYFSVAPPEQSSEWIDRPKMDFQNVVSWARTMGISRHNLYYLSKIIRFHTGEVSEKWAEVEEMSDGLSGRLLESLDHPLNLALMRLYVELRTNLVSLLKKYPKLYQWNRKKKNRLLAIISRKNNQL